MVFSDQCSSLKSQRPFDFIITKTKVAVTQEVKRLRDVKSLQKNS